MSLSYSSIFCDSKKKNILSNFKAFWGVFFKNPLVLLGEGLFMVKFLIHTTFVQIAYFLYLLVRVRDHYLFFLCRERLVGFGGWEACAKKNWLSRGGIPKIRGSGHGKCFSKTLKWRYVLTNEVLEFKRTKEQEKRQRFVCIYISSMRWILCYYLIN